MKPHVFLEAYNLDTDRYKEKATYLILLYFCVYLSVSKY
jgi:hypothetical protein